MYALLRLFLRLSVILRKNLRMRLILRIRIFVYTGPALPHVEVLNQIPLLVEVDIRSCMHLLL